MMISEGEDKEEDDHDDEESEDDSSEDESDDEDENLVRVSYKDIKTKNNGQYKEFFKDFPGLKKAFFREQAYTEDILLILVMLRMHLRLRKVLRTFVIQCLSGNAEAFLKDVQDASPQGFKTFTSNFLAELK